VYRYPWDHPNVVPLLRRRRENNMRLVRSHEHLLRFSCPRSIVGSKRVYTVRLRPRRFRDVADQRCEFGVSDGAVPESGVVIRQDLEMNVITAVLGVLIRGQTSRSC
jgi:hypothetical protein